MQSICSSPPFSEKNCANAYTNCQTVLTAQKTALPAEISHQIYIFRDFLMQKYKPPRFATVYVPARRLYEFDILRRFALLNARQTHNFFVLFHPQQGTKTRTKTAESITQNSFEDNACLQYFDGTAKRFRTNIDV